ncbi:Peptidyl-prolyl cis-trans isomerase [Orchesella cincta]|uniref:peptidylprolyl isomerase n=1 Tax=Orchesella cincta TaxID=48709 RepID=A0A1D2ND51_ORCCI|nr:Peptidyl-prolyl cis-trans isomerase [Orchesella cincta]
MSNAMYSNPKPSSAEKKERLRARRHDDAEFPLRKYAWNKHRERVMTAQPIVDTSNPIVLKNIYTSPTAFNRSVSNFVRIERENARMLQRIANIMESEPAVSTKLRSSTRSYNSRSRSRQMKLLQITFDNLKMYQRIEAQKPMYSRKEQMNDFAKHERKMELRSYYPLFWKKPVPQPWDKLANSALDNATKCPKPVVFFDLETDREALGQVLIELRADIVPFTAENFRSLCTGEQGLSYKCTEIHRIIPGVLWQGGDVSGKEGRGGKSIYGDFFPDENFKLKHLKPGTVSMVNAGKDTNSSQFLITAKKIESLNGVNVVVGKVMCGMEVLEKISSMVTPSGRAKDRVWIARCGQVNTDEEAGEKLMEQYNASLEGSEGGGDQEDAPAVTQDFQD